MRRTLPLLIGVVAALVLVVGGSRAKVEHRASAPPSGGGGGLTGAQSTGKATPRPPAPVPLSDGWRYLADPDNIGLSDGWGQGGAPGAGWAPVSVPNDFNPTVTSSADQGTVGWYELQFTGPAVASGRGWSLSFESVRRNATVWLNGRELGHHSDPYSPFALPATSLRPNAANTLIVRVDNIRGRGSLPEDWWDWGGIMGPVTLEPQGRLAISNLGVLPQLGCRFSCGRLLIEGSVVNQSAQRLAPQLIVRVTAPNGRITTNRRQLAALKSGAAEGVHSGSAGWSIPVRGPIALWSPHHPALYTVQLELDAGGRVEQLQSLRVGLRSVQVKGGLMSLNGRRLWLHGAAIHEDMIGRGAALTDGDIATIVSELRSAGANITRTHYLLSERLLDALDAAGIMVWEQPPVDHADPALRTSAGRTRALGLLRSTLLGDRSHPSVIVNSVGNELSPNPDATPGTLRYLQQAIPLARALDPAAEVGLDTYCYPGFPKQSIYSKLDVLGISSYFGWYPGRRGHSIANFSQLKPFLRLSHGRYPRQALTVSEFGAEGLYDGPANVKGSYEFQSGYLQSTIGVVGSLPFMNGTIYWTLREFAVGPGWTGGAQLPAGDQPDGLHHKGLIAYDGSPKPAFVVAQRMLRETPSFVH